LTFWQGSKEDASFSSEELMERSTAVATTKATSALSMGFEGAAYWASLSSAQLVEQSKAAFASGMGFEVAAYWASSYPAKLVERSTAVATTKATSASCMGFEGAAHWASLSSAQLVKQSKAASASGRGFAVAAYWASSSPAEFLERSTAVAATEAASASCRVLDEAAYSTDLEEEPYSAAIKITRADQVQQVDNDAHLTCAIWARTDGVMDEMQLQCWCVSVIF